MPSNLDRALRGLRARRVLRDFIAAKSEYPREFATRLIKETYMECRKTRVLWQSIGELNCRILFTDMNSKRVAIYYFITGYTDQLKKYFSNIYIQRLSCSFVKDVHILNTAFRKHFKSFNSPFLWFLGHSTVRNIITEFWGWDSFWLLYHLLANLDLNHSILHSKTMVFRCWMTLGWQLWREMSCEKWRGNPCHGWWWQNTDKSAHIDK